MEYQTVVTTLLSEENLENVSRIKVAVLDTGIDPSHPFIQEKWMRPETDDNNDPLEDRGYFDFVSESSAPTTPEDTCGHGTHVAGLILQLAPFVKLYVARVFQDGVLDEKAAKRVAEVKSDVTLENIVR
jgi:subtilisin family serine protease